MNDSRGHEAGDLVLQTVSRTLAGGLRPWDVVGRWGGEEFLVIPNENLLRGVAERRRALVEATNVRAADWSIEVTASLGATLFRPTDTCQTVTHRADQLMYESKAAGRNRVTVG